MDENVIVKQESITVLGNPKKPNGDAGRIMLTRMNESHAGLTEWALSHIDFDGGDTVLDIGCGGGAALRRISPFIKTGHLTGIDYSEVSVALSRENNAEDIMSGKLDVIEASVEALPFCGETFDKIITVESFYFWPSHGDNLREVCRVLKKGGKFLIAADVYTFDGMSREAEESIEKYGLFAPTADEFESLLKGAGFSDVKLYTERGSDRITVVGEK